MKKALSVDQALYKLAAYCSTAERCTVDIVKKLEKWEILPEKHSEIIERLKKERFLDEKRYCRAFVNDKIKFMKWGILKIKYELRKKNIPESIISEALEEMYPKEASSVLNDLLLAKKRTTKGKNDYEIKQKLIRYAIGKGFPPGEIFQSMKKIYTDFEESEFP